MALEAPAVVPRPPCIETPVEAILTYTQRLARAAEQREELPLSLEAVFFLLVITLAQCSLGVSGGIGEVGSSRPEGGGQNGILSFQALSLLRGRHEPLFLCGPFLGVDGDGFGPVDPLFHRAEAFASASAPVSALRRLAAPGNLTDLRLLGYGGPRGFRLLRLGRARDANETRRLLRSAACALGRGGLLLLEGVQGMGDRPGLQEGLHRFLLEDGGLRDGARLVPFLWAGKRGGLFFAEEAHAEVYRRSVQSALPAAAQLLNEVHDTKFLYGSRVVSVSWEATPLDFEILARNRPDSFSGPGSD